MSFIINPYYFDSIGKSITFSPDEDIFNTSNFDAYSIPVSVALRDGFDGVSGTSITAHSPETGGAWTVHPDVLGGTAVLSNNSTIYGTGGALEAWFVNATLAPTTSYEVSYKLKIHTTIFSSAVYTGVILDANNAAMKHGYQFLFVPTGVNTGNWILQRALSGSVTNLPASSGSPNGKVYANGSELDVRCQIDRRYIGNTGVNEDVVYLRLWVNGIKIAEWVDNAATLVPSTRRIALKFVRTSTSTTGHHFGGISIQEISEVPILSDTIRLSPNTVEQQIMIRAFGTAWDSLQPSFLVEGATKVSQSIVNYNRVLLTLTTGSESQLITITDPTTGSKVKLSIADNTTAPMLTGWTRRKQFKVTGSTEGIGVQKDYLIPLTIHRGSGTNNGRHVYIGTSHRSDWGDIRITDRSGVTRLPFAIIRKESSYIDILIYAPIINYSENSFFLYWGKPASVDSTYKIASITDQHYDTLEYDNRHLALTFIDNFVTRMATYQPHLAVSNGDKTGASVSTEATQLGWYQSVIDHFAAVSAHTIDVKDGVAPGNHDFEYLSFSNVLAKHANETWMESGVFYGSWESDEYQFISLDANYDDADDTHLDLDHHGYGYINATQLTWFEATLTSAVKPVIIFCHQPLSEIDSEQFTLTKEIYHTKNRQAVRKIIEDSGKVICVIHGHTHFDRIDVINNIPYINTGNLTNTGGFGETPATNEGNWTFIELDKEAMTVRVKRESKIGATYATVYESWVPFGQTVFFEDIGENHALTFAYGNKGMFEKSSILKNATETYVTDDTYLYKFPVNRVSEPYLSDGTIKFEGRTDAPNYGRTYWNFSPQKRKFQVEFEFLKKNTTKQFIVKLGGDSLPDTPGPYIALNASGNIVAFNNLSATTLQAFNIDTWYKMKLIVDTETDRYSVYVDDVLKANNFVFYNGHTFTFFRQMEIVTESGLTYVNNMRIRNYSSPEPVLKWV